MKYELPEGVSLAQALPERYTKETKLDFLDSTYGAFKSSIKAMEDAGKRVSTGPISTHPEAIQARREQTNIQRYGTTHTSSNPEVQAKRKATTKLRYGVEHAAQLTKFQEKAKRTLLKNHGVTNPMRSQEIRDKQRATTLANYGVDNPAKSKKVQARMRATSLARYGHENPMHDPDIRQKQLDKVLSKYEANDKLNVLPNGKYVIQYCAEFDTNPCPQYANLIFRTISPQAAQDWIDNHKSNISNLELVFLALTKDYQSARVNKKIHQDFDYRPDVKISDTLYVDLDGLLYHSEKYRKDNQYHKTKRLAYEKAGLVLLQYRADELIKRPHIIKSMLDARHGKNITRHYARKLDIKPVDTYQGFDFLELNHLMGGIHNTQHIGLWNGDELLMIISYKHYKKEDKVELDRVCTKLHTVVVGGLSKLLKYIIGLTSTRQVVSFVDCRYADGHSLTKLGFTKVSESLGWKWTDGNNTYNRRKAKTRAEAETKGWYRIYDAGQAKYTLTLGDSLHE